MRNCNEVSQLELFDSCHGILADDERGRITYIPRFVGVEPAQAWLTELRSGVRWRSQRREMYDREVVVPRLLGHFRLDPAPDATPPAILEAARRLVAHLAVPFNSVGLTYTHGVPKTSATIGERVSLAFRVKPGQQPPNAIGDRRRRQGSCSDGRMIG